MRIASAVLALAATGAFATSAYAYIPPEAVSASHQLEQAAAAIHEHLHVSGYPSSYGSHPLEGTATALHDTLHDWSNGNASEADVAAARDAYCDAFKTFLQMILPAGVLFAGDSTLDQLFIDVLRKTLRAKILLVRAGRPGRGR